VLKPVRTTFRCAGLTLDNLVVQKCLA
jgi:hypothetical protein